MKKTSAAQNSFRPQLFEVILPIVLTLAVQALVSMTAVAIPVFMPVVSAELHFQASFVGLFVSLIYIGAMISAPVSGYFIERFGAVCVSQVCLFFCAAGLGLFSLASLLCMIIGSLIIGLGYGPTTPASSHLLIKTTPPQIMSMVFSIKQTGVPVGGALAGACVPFLVLSFGWQAAALLVGGLSLTLMVCIQPFRRRYDQDVSKESGFSLNHVIGPLKLAVTHRRLRQVVFASFFFATMQLCFISFIVTYLLEDIGMSLVRAGAMLSTAQVAGIIGRIVWGVMADRCLSPRLMLGLLGIAMACASFLTALFSPHWPNAGVLLVCILFGSVAIGWNGVYLAEVARVVKPELAGLATGGSLFFTFFGVLLGLPVFSMLVNVTGSYALGFCSTAGVTAVCGLILCFSRQKGASTADPPAERR